MEDGTEEEKQKLMDKEEVPEAKKPAKRDGTRYGGVHSFTLGHGRRCIPYNAQPSLCRTHEGNFERLLPRIRVFLAFTMQFLFV